MQRLLPLALAAAVGASAPAFAAEPSADITYIAIALSDIALPIGGGTTTVTLTLTDPTGNPVSFAEDLELTPTTGNRHAHISQAASVLHAGESTTTFLVKTDAGIEAGTVIHITAKLGDYGTGTDLAVVDAPIGGG